MRKTPAKGLKVVFRRSSLLTKAVVLIAVVLCIATLMTLVVSLKKQQDKNEELRQQAMALEVDNSRLEQYIRELGTKDAIIRIAQEKLGLVPPDSIVIQPD